MLLFVYGTLKRDEPNCNWLTNPENGQAKFVANGKLARKYPLVIAPRYNIPFLLDHPDNGQNVEGQVYEIDHQMLAALDELEMYPQVYTRRQELILVNQLDLGHVNAWVYFLPSFPPKLSTLPYLKSYSSVGEHALRDISRAQFKCLEDVI